jgi:hypothetical protein
LNACEKISGELVVSCGDGAKVLEFIEDALDEIAFTIEREIAGPRHALGDWLSEGSPA